MAQGSSEYRDVHQERVFRNLLPLFKKRVKKKPAQGADNSTLHKCKPAAPRAADSDLTLSSQQSVHSFENILAPDAPPRALGRVTPGKHMARQGSGDVYMATSLDTGDFLRGS